MNQTINGRDAVPSVPFIFFDTRKRESPGWLRFTLRRARSDYSRASHAKEIRDVGDDVPPSKHRPVELHRRVCERPALRSLVEWHSELDASSLTGS